MQSYKAIDGVYWDVRIFFLCQLKAYIKNVFRRHRMDMNENVSCSELCIRLWKWYLMVDLMNCGVGSYCSKLWCIRPWPWYQIVCLILGLVCMFDCFFLFGGLCVFNILESLSKIGRLEKVGGIPMFFPGDSQFLLTIVESVCLLVAVHEDDGRRFEASCKVLRKISCGKLTIAFYFSTISVEFL